MPRSLYVQSAFLVLTFVSITLNNAATAAPPVKAELPESAIKVEAAPQEKSETTKTKKVVGPIKFYRSLKEARAANTENKPIVIQFTASWCGACRTMESGTLNSLEVQKVSDDYIWAKIDIDEHRSLAQKYQVTLIPQTTVLDTERQLIVTKKGAMGSAAFIRFLEKGVEVMKSFTDSSSAESGSKEY